MYIKKIREPILIHRDYKASQVETRVDYIDLTAFGVDFKYEDHNQHLENVKKIDDQIKKYTESSFGRII